MDVLSHSKRVWIQALVLAAVVTSAPSAWAQGVTVTNSSLPIGGLAQQYSAQLQATGGQSPYSWQQTGGTLPPGVTLSATGALSSGAGPGQTGTFSFDVMVTSQDNLTGVASLSITVVDVATTDPLPSGQVGVPYSQQLAATVNGGTWSITGGSIPGLSLSNAGVLSGIPTNYGNFQITATANIPDPFQQGPNRTASKSLTITIAPDLPRITTSSLGNGTTGTAFSQGISAAGGVPPYTIIGLAGSVPPGLSVSSNTLTGTPQLAGVYGVQFRVTDSVGGIGTSTVSMTIRDPLSISTSFLSPGVVGSAYTGGVQAAGGQGPYTISAVSGLPPGVGFSNNQLTGTPSQAQAQPYSVTFNVTDTIGGSASRTLSLTIVNPLLISTSSLPPGVTGSNYSQTVSASGGQAPYSIVASQASLPPLLGFNGTQLVGVPNTPGLYSAQFTVTDNLGFTAMRSIPITVVDPLAISTATLPPGVTGNAYSLNITAAGGQAPYTITAPSGVPAGITFNGSQFSGTPTTMGTFQVQFNVTDNLNFTATRTIQMFVVDPLAISTSSLANGTTGLSYSQNVSATGGQAPYTITAVPASLPPGLGFNGTALVGSPSLAGAYTVQFNVSDNLSFTASRSLTITVRDPLNITTSALGAGSVGVGYSQGVQAGGGFPGYTITANPSTVPPGLSFNGTALVGTPTQAGSFTVAFTVTDTQEGSASRSLGLSITPPLAISTTSLPEGRTGIAYSQSVQATGGLAPYTITATPATLPPGLTFNGTQLTGSPTTPGVYPIQFQVVDGNTTTATRTISVTVRDPLQISTTSLPQGVVNVAYSQTVQAAGGLGPYTITAGGSLPPGVTFNGTQLAGTPTTAGVYAIQFQVGDTLSGTASRTLSVTINPPLTISTSTLPEGRTTVAYSQAIQASGGVAPYTITAAPAGIPPGLTFNGTVLAGTPTQTGDYSIQFSVTDSQNNPASRTLAITVRNPLMISTTSAPAATTGTAYAQPIEASGGLGPYTITATPSALPAGITFNGTQLTGIPTLAGIYPIPFQVTDSLNGTASRTITLAVRDPLTISTTSLSDGAAASFYTQTVQAAGGLPPYTITALPTTLPPGISFNGTVLSGTPTAFGVFPIQFRVVDAAEVTASKTLSLTIRSALGISIGSLTDGTVGVPYSQTIQASGGTAPYTITASPSTLPTGLSFNGSQIAGTPTSAGGYLVQFQVRDSNGIAADVTVSLNIVTTATDGVRVFPLSLRFNAFQGGALPPPQIVEVTSTTGATFTYTSALNGATQSSPSWLTLTGDPGTTPAQLHISADPTGLAPATYTANLVIRSGVQPAFSVPIVLIVDAPAPALDVSPRIIQRSSRNLTPRGEAEVIVRNLGGGAVTSLDARLAGSSAWAQVIGTPGNLGPVGASYLRVALDTTGLRPGAYRDELVIHTGIGDTRVPISVVVEDSGPALSASVHGLRLAGRQGDAANSTASFSIRNRGTAGSTANWTATIVRGADLFTITPAQGTATPGSPSPVTIGLKPNATATAGAQSALLRIDAAGAQSTPEYVVLVADISASNAQPVVNLTPAGLAFTAAARGTAPASQTITVSTGASTMAYTVSASTLATPGTSPGNSNWLTIGAQTGTATATTPGVIQINVNQGTLTPGVYTGLVTVNAAGQVLSSYVTLFVLPQAASTTSTDTQTVNASSKPGADPQLAAAACTPTSAAILQTALNEGFAVPAGWPATLTVRLFDNCGNTLPAGDVVATFSNGDAPIVLEGDGQLGVFTAAWQPGVTTSQATVRLEATAGELTPARLELRGTVQSNAIAPPALVTAGLLNNLNPVYGGSLAPGTITQIYGANLGSQPLVATTTPLPTVLQGVEAIIGGLSAPIYYASNNQLTVQVPAELAPNKQYSVILTTPAGYSQPTMVPIVPVQPGAVQAADGSLFAMHSNLTNVNTTNPAKPNELISVYLVGMGSTTPSVPSGNAAPVSPQSWLDTTASVSIDGQPAEILFEGLSAGRVGLYQINFKLPANVRTGMLDVVISQNGITANPAKLAVSQ